MNANNKITICLDSVIVMAKQILLDQWQQTCWRLVQVANLISPGSLVTNIIGTVSHVTGVLDHHPIHLLHGLGHSKHDHLLLHGVGHEEQQVDVVEAEVSQAGRVMSLAVSHSKPRDFLS